MPFRKLTVSRGQGVYAEGLRTSIRTNAPAYAFSVMITSAFGVVGALAGSPDPWEVFLFATGSLLGFLAVHVVATRAFRSQSTDAERSEVLMLAAALNGVSVLGGVGAAALAAWPAAGWVQWLAGPLAATVAFLLLNGVEFSVAEYEEEGAAGR